MSMNSPYSSIKTVFRIANAGLPLEDQLPFPQTFAEIKNIEEMLTPPSSPSLRPKTPFSDDVGTLNINAPVFYPSNGTY